MENVKTLAKQYLTFCIDDVEYGVNVLRVKEVLVFDETTNLIGRTDFVRGIINLRNTVVPVLDLKMKCSRRKTEKTDSTCIVVLEIIHKDNPMEAGVLVDSVRQVMNISAEDIEPPPEIGTAIDSDYIEAIGKSGSDFTVILDIDRVFSEDELEKAKESIINTGKDQAKN